VEFPTKSAASEGDGRREAEAAVAAEAADDVLEEAEHDARQLRPSGAEVKILIVA
jgi:hypothetical protein